MIRKDMQKILSFLIISCYFLLYIFKASAIAFVFTDDIGRKVYLDKPPKRIISLAPSITEILFYLDLGDRVVGVTNFCNYPPEATKKEKVGLILNPDIEKIISLKPHIVFATTEGNRPQVINTLERFKIPVYVLSPHKVEDILMDIIHVGEIANVKNIAYRKVNILKDRISKIKNLAAKKQHVKTLFLLSVNPLISAGKGSFIDDIITLAGGINIVDPTPIPYPRINRELILLKQPDVIIGPPYVINTLISSTEWRYISTLRKLKIYKINQDIITRPGPRIVEALEIIYKLLHKEEK